MYRDRETDNETHIHIHIKNIEMKKKKATWQSIQKFLINNNTSITQRENRKTPQ